MSNNTNTNNDNNDWKDREVGALWRRSGKSQKYLSGFIKTGDELNPQELRVMIFSNRYKSENEKAPDFVIYQSEPMEKKTSTTNATSETRQSQSKIEEENLDELEELLK